MWTDPSSLDAAVVKDIQTILRETQGFTGQIAEVIGLRVQMGTNRHIIFRDEKGSLYSAAISSGVYDGQTGVRYFKQVE
jgi:hypothetical protein